MDVDRFISWDLHFNKIQKIIKQTKETLNKLKIINLSRYETNKFNLNVDVDERKKDEEEGCNYLFIFIYL